MTLPQGQGSTVVVTLLTRTSFKELTSVTKNTPQTMMLQVRGMSCAGCEQRIKLALRRLDGVVQATADHTSGQVRVRFDPTGTDRDAVLDRIVLAGYTLDDGGCEGLG